MAYAARSCSGLAFWRERSGIVSVPGAVAGHQVPFPDLAFLAAGKLVE
jgi:hypothetical protein